jgi:peptidoglycan/xylan/chitin deacetylase (PgdA/CDA1 family)
VVGCVPRGNEFVFGGSARRHEIALTFDDGPWPDPPSIRFVQLLHRYHAPATFFEVGEQIHEYDPTGSIERLMLRFGDMIGNHSWAHPQMPALSPAQQRGQLKRTQAAIRQASGFTPCLFRAPYGAVDSSLLRVARSLQLTTIQWSVDTVDWSLPGTATIAQRAIEGAHNGAIILEHFGGGPRYQTYNAIPIEVRALRARGYRFVTVTQLLGYRLIYR